MARTIPVTLTNMCMLRRTDGMVLVQDRRNPNWPGLTFPGGHVEHGESLTAAVIREMREETGLTVHRPRLVGTKDWMNDDGSRYIVLLYAAEEYEGELRASDEGDVRWMSLDALRAHGMADGMESMLRVFLDDNVTEMWFDRTDGGWNEILL